MKSARKQERKGLRPNSTECLTANTKRDKTESLDHLNSLIRQKDEEIEELKQINALLRMKTQIALNSCAELTSSLQSILPSSQIQQDIQTYGAFVVSYAGPRLEELLTQRIAGKEGLEQLLKSGNYAAGLAVTLKLLSDLIVVDRSDNSLEESQDTALSFAPTIQSLDTSQDCRSAIKDSEQLLASLTVQSQRLQTLSSLTFPGPLC